jgi:hypothetical protein
MLMKRRNKMFKKLGIVSAGLMVIMGLCSTGFTQEYDEAGEVEMESEFATGVVKAVSPTSLRIVDMDSEDQAEITFVINEESILENIESINEIAEGDEVYVDYIISGENNVAINIFKMGLMEEEYTLDEVE